MTKKQKEYKKHLEREARKFRLTQKDLTNLTDLGLMIPAWFVKGVLKPNKMEKWFWDFFGRVENITLYDLKDIKKK